MGRCRRHGPFPPPGDAATRGECFAPCERQGSVMPYDTEVVDQGEERLAALWEQPLDEDVDAELADPAIRTLFATPDGAGQPARASRRFRRGSGASTRDRRPCWRRSRRRSLRPQSTRRAVMVATGIGAAIMLPTGIVALTGSSDTPPARSPSERVAQPAAQGALPRRSADHRQSRAAPVQRRRGARRPPAVRRTRVHRASFRRRQRGARRDMEARAESAAPRAQVIAPPPVPSASSACDEFPPC